MTESEFQALASADIHRIVNGVRAATGSSAPLAPVWTRGRCWNCSGTGGHDVGNGAHQLCYVCAGTGVAEYEVRK